MFLTFTNLTILAGLAAVAIPPLVHLLHRRRYRIVDWGAMQFLQQGQRRQHRVWLDELLLMLLRMGLIALLVFALASPVAESSYFTAAAESRPRDIVLLIDPSYSMAAMDGRQASPWQEALAWADEWMGQLRTGDRVAIALARAPFQPGPWLTDPENLKDALAALPMPRGNSDWPATVDAARRFLRSTRTDADRSIVLIKDRQRFGWADAATLTRWDDFSRLPAKEPPVQSLVVELGAERHNLPNFALAPLRCARNLPPVNQSLQFTSALSVQGLEKDQLPRRVRIEVNNKTVGEIKLPVAAELQSGKNTLTFAHRFAKPGSHLVSLVIDPGNAPDALAGDNRQDLALVVVGELPVLIVDGADQFSPEGPSHFLANALKSMMEPAAAKHLRVVTTLNWKPAILTNPATRPRAVILADVARWSAAQGEALAQFLAEGGSVLIVPGARAETGQAFYNEELYRGGQGWLPARLVAVAEAKPAPRLDLARSQVAPLEVFRQHEQSGLGQASFPRWWQVELGPRAVPVAWLTNGAPWLIEQSVGKGRVLLCTTPLDRSWNSSLPALPEFPILVHELLNYLAARETSTFNLAPGQAFRVPDQYLDRFAPSCTSVGPSGKAISVKLAETPALIFPHEGAGPYHLKNQAGESLHFVARFDPGESDLQSCTDEDRAAVATRAGLRYQSEEALSTQDADVTEPQELWWLFLLGVIGLLLGEIWLTRRRALARDSGTLPSIAR